MMRINETEICKNHRQNKRINLFCVIYFDNEVKWFTDKQKPSAYQKAALWYDAEGAHSAALHSKGHVSVCGVSRLRTIRSLLH